MLAVFSFRFPSPGKRSTFQKNEHSLPPDMHTYLCVSRDKKWEMFVFLGKFGLFCFPFTSVLRFSFLPYYRRIILKHFAPIFSFISMLYSICQCLLHSTRMYWILWKHYNELGYETGNEVLNRRCSPLKKKTGNIMNDAKLSSLEFFFLFLNFYKFQYCKLR